MRMKIRYLATVLATAGAGTAIVLAPSAGALPNCTNTGPTTTQCERPGNAQIITSPSNTNQFPWVGWPFGAIGIGIGGFGR